MFKEWKYIKKDLLGKIYISIKKFFYTQIFMSKSASEGNEQNDFQRIINIVLFKKIYIYFSNIFNS